jgi:hypothetical protein
MTPRRSTARARLIDATPTFSMVDAVSWETSSIELGPVLS